MAYQKKSKSFPGISKIADLRFLQPLLGIFLDALKWE